MADGVTEIQIPDVIDEKTTFLHIHSDIGTNATLHFFTKPSYLSKLKKRYVNEKDGSNLLKHTESIKFYKKRIISLFKDFLKGEEPSHCNDELKHLSHLFAIHSINYFESVDKQDIIQQNHTQGDTSNNILGIGIGIGIDTELDTELDTALDTELDTELDTIEELNTNSMEDANSLMMRKTISIPSLDNYVIQKTSSDNSGNIKKIIPLKLEIDLKNPTLKTKGVKPKGLKKNFKKKEGICETSISETSISETSISETSISEKDLSQ